MNNIDRNKHNKYVVGWTPTIPLQDTTPSDVLTSTTIIVGGGGSGSGTGLTNELAKKLESIECGALVNQNAYSYLSLSDNTNTIIQAARLLEDTANLSIIGKQGIETSLVCELKLPETTITSTGSNTGVYKISYGKVVNKIETPNEDPEGEPIITEEVTWPLVITYISGELLLTTSFDTIKLINLGVETILTDYQIETNETGIISITKDQSGLIFDQIKFTLTTTPEATEEIPEPESTTTEVLVLNAVVYNYCTYYISNTGDGYWKLDENGNLYTDYNAYSTKELSAYGLGEGTGEAGGGAGYLYELGDVDKESASSPINGGILQYNSTTRLWEVTDGSNINPDLKDYAKVEWVNDLIEALIGGAPADLDTLGEIAVRLLSLEVLLEWFEWDDTNQAIKALFNLYGVGEISAYGYRSGGGETGGKSYLNELEDVDITNLLDQGILQYNATTKMWEVTDGSSIRPDLSGYAETTWVTTQINNAVANLIDGAPADLNTLGKIATVIEELQLFLDWFSFVDGRIRANYNLWGVGEISAYGHGDGGGTTGTSFLRELLDVQLSESLKTGDLLMYDASTQMWLNVDKSSVGLNETELRLYLETNNYLQEGDVTWNNLSGKPDTFKTNISLIENLNSGWDTLLTNSPTDYVTRWPTFSEVTDKPTTLAGYGITDAYTKEQTDDRYVNITGDTMTGNLTLPALIANDYIRIGSTARLEYDSTNNAIKVTNASGGVVNFYATGEVSAYGMGSESTIVGYLDDLNDVTISNPTDGQALMFNGSQWVNQTIQQGLDENALEDYLNDNGYLPSDATANEGIAGRLAYYVNATTIDDYGSTVGSGNKLWYLKEGVPTTSTTSVGDQYTPVYLSNGYIYESEKAYLVNRDAMRDSSAGTNWNNLLTAGMYFTTTEGSLSGETGSPGNYYGYGTLLVFAAGTSAYGGAVTLTYFTHGNDFLFRTTYSGSSSRWQSWNHVLTNKNYTSYTVSKTGSGASGTWSISITGNAGTATRLLTSRTIWGQSFNGSSNISGALSDATTILASTGIASTWSDTWSGGGKTNPWYGINWKYVNSVYCTTISSYPGMLFHTANGNAVFTQNGDFGIGTTSPLYRLHVNSTIASDTGVYALSWIQVGQARLKYDNSSNSLYVEKQDGSICSFYATGEVSAYGAGSESTISGYLNDLEDVTISNVITGLALIYNGSLWVNQTIQQGLDENALEDYLNDNGYLPSNTTVNEGVAGRLAYYSSASTIDDYSSTIGSGTRLWYLNAGTPTNSSSTVGGNETPVFLSNGSIVPSSKYFLVDIGAMKDTSTGTNWNNLLRPGMYFLAAEGGLGSETGSPGSYYGYGNLLVFGSGSSAYGGARTQLYFEHGNGAAYRTTYSASSSRWQAWNKILTNRNIGNYALTPGNYSNTLNSVYVNVSGDTMTGALILNSTLKVSGASTFNSLTTHNYGILTSTLTANLNITAKGAIVLDYYGGTWLSMCTRTDDGIYSNNKASSGSAHMMMRMRNYNGDYVVFGGLNNETGVYYFTNSNVTSGVNNYSARTIWTPEGMSVHGTRIYTNGYMRIGDGAIRWDSSTNSLYVEKYDGSRANLYATGEVSAYGRGTGTPTAQVVSIMDVRNDTIYPNTYSSGMRIFFKKNGTAVLTSSLLGGEFHTLILINKWHDSSGGRVHQIALGDNNSIWSRVSNSSVTGWESWQPVKPNLGNWILNSNGPDTCYFEYGSVPFYVAFQNGWCPGVQKHGVLYLGDSTHRWRLLYASNAVNTSSDIRLKNIVKYVDLDIKDIAKAPSFTYTWKDGKFGTETYVGGSAQYWENILPEVVTKGEDGYLSMEYDRITYASVIALAKETESIEERVTRLESENIELKAKIEEYEKLNRLRTT